MQIRETQVKSIGLRDVQDARERIAGGVYATPCPESITLSEICDARIYCKLEYLQRTGSFKERGARNALLLLNEDQRKLGVIAASAGNHALALAYHGGLLGIPVTVVMPRFAPLIKVSTCRRLRARVILHGENFDAARVHAEELARNENLTYVQGFDEAAIIAGQGTIGLEILDQLAELDAIVLPVGGGGLIAGVALAVKSLRAGVRIIGVEAENAAGFTAALRAGQPCRVEVKPTLADGLAVGRVGDLSFDIARRYVDDVVTVTENDLALAVYRLVELEKCVVEGAGAACLAAFLGGTLTALAGKRVALVLSGGNIDLMHLDRVIQTGMVSDGRLCRFTAVISDRPGGLAKLTDLIASAGASVREISHDRAFSGPDVTLVRVSCVVETTDARHVEGLFEKIRTAGVQIAPS